ncbi:MAG: hypothetical protein RMJ33_12155 [Saprospiraceae bacterium]|nr:hypothetical protein [Saprospiraceae bacterium]MDW8230580.1 hypothetical protein [Saprospiraceae bacterium]
MRTLNRFFSQTLFPRLLWVALALCALWVVHGFATGPTLRHGPLLAARAQALSVSATSNGPLCAGTTLNLTATVTNGTPPLTFAWSGPAGFTSSAQNPARANTTTAHSGTYGVTVTDGTGATASATVSVQIHQPATANAGPDRALCVGASHPLNGAIGGSATSATWSASVPGGTFAPNPQMLNATYIPPAGFKGSITLTLTTNDPPGPCPAASDQVMLTYATPGAMACNDTVRISAPPSCPVIVTPDMALEGDVLDDLYTVTIFTPSGQNLGNTVTAQHFGIPLTVRVRENCSANFCITTAIVSDALPPVFASCQNITLPCLVTNFTPGYLDTVLKVPGARPIAVDNCTPTTLTYQDVWVNVGCNETFQGQTDLTGYVRRTWTAADAYGNTSTCVQFLYFKRLRAQDLTLPSNVTVSCDNSMTDPATVGAPSYTFNGVTFYLTAPYNCGIGVLFSDQLSFKCDGEYAIVRKWQLLNNACPGASPASIEHTQVIYAIDNKGPVIQCPGNLTVSTDPLACCATVDLPDVVIEDACSRIRDASAIIQIRDLITGNVISQVGVSAQLSNFPANSPLKKDTLAVFGQTPCLPVGQHTVQYFSEDVCGAASSCTFTLSVMDLVPPVAACIEVTQVSLGINGASLVNASTFNTGSYDNCGPVYFKARRLEANSCQTHAQFHDQVRFCCEDVGKTIDVVLRVYDVPVPSGSIGLSQLEARSNDCAVKVLVDDKLRPVCVPPANVTVSCEDFDASLCTYGMATAADNCCADTAFEASVNWSQFDTLCSKGTITRFFQARDCHGLTSTCSQRIVVNYRQHYYVRFPNDVILNSCNGTADFGQPTFFAADCETIGISHTDQYFTLVPGACQQIERTWRIINWCAFDPNKGCTQVPNPNPHPQLDHASNLAGPVVSAPGTLFPWAPTVVKITANDAQPTNFSQYWSESVNCYEYKQLIRIADGQKPIVLDCSAVPQEICDMTDNDNNLWNQNYWLDVKTLSNDMSEAPVELRITATDDCSKANLTFRYQLFLDLDGNGSMETVVTNQHSDAGIVYYNNASNPNFTGGIARIFDRRSVPVEHKYRFVLETRAGDENRTAFVRWSTAAQPNAFVAPQLPYGTHKIKWFISDGCGNEQMCEYMFTIRDCKAPTIVCANGLSGNIGANKSLTVGHQLFVQTASDNSTPAHRLVYGIRKKGQGKGFPLLSNGAPQTSLSFDCTELGFQLVEVWARDLEGNADFCETFIHVQNNDNNCNNSQATVAGAVLTADGSGLEDAQVGIVCQTIQGSAPPISKQQTTDSEGQYRFDNAIPIAVNYTLTPVKDNDPLNGVSTFDLVLINKHILGLEPFTSPYQFIAADVNNSQSVTTYDILELRKLILGIYTDLPENTSWRFIDKAYSFPDPSNPWKEVFPESKSVWNFQTHRLKDDFVAVKVGDLNNTAVANSATFADDRTAGAWLLDTDDRYVKAGEYFSATFSASEAISGYQLTLQYRDLECLGIEGAAAEHFAHFPDKKAITAAVDVPVDAGQPAFTLRLRARAAGQLSQMLRLSNSITRAEAYPDAHSGERFDVGLRFRNGSESVVAGLPFELYQNTPNPWVNKTQIGFYLPEAAEATLMLHDEMGRLVFTKTASYPRGYNTVFVERALLGGGNTFSYTLNTPFGSATRKMILTR